MKRYSTSYKINFGQHFYMPIKLQKLHSILKQLDVLHMHFYVYYESVHHLSHKMQQKITIKKNI
jgi:hypothetical protein